MMPARTHARLGKTGRDGRERRPIARDADECDESVAFRAMCFLLVARSPN